MTESNLCGILITCLKKNQPGPDRELLTALSPQDWNDLLTLAAWQRVVSILRHRLQQKKLIDTVPVETVKMLRNALFQITARNLRLNAELARLLAALKTESIHLVLLKGMVMANTVYESIGLREMNDIDVLAKPDDLARIVGILTSLGYVPEDPITDINLTVQAANHLPAFFNEKHTKIEVHANITRPGENYSIDPQGLWQRAVPVQIAGCNTLMLSAEDMLLHLCLHTSYQHQFDFGLRPFCDIAEIINRFQSNIDWKTIVERAVSQKWQRGVYLALLMAVDLAGAEVPGEILRKLQPADITDTVLQAVRLQIFTDKYYHSNIPKPFARLLESRRPDEKIKIFWQRVFLPKTQIAYTYSIPMNSLKIYTGYLRRFVDVLRRHSRTLQQYHKNDNDLKSMIKRKKLIADWVG